ncbi:Glycerophosphodiester phosphodiesterase [Bertholletia excelsa]
MALRAVQVSDVPSASVGLHSSRLSTSTGVEVGRDELKEIRKFMVVGHRGNGMNMLQSEDRRMKAFKENSLLSFEAASKFAVDFIEFDVQVTKDDCPVIFHDDNIVSEENGGICEKRVTALSLSEFLGYGPQREPGKMGKSLLRKTKEGNILCWNVEQDDSLCTLEEAFHKVHPSLGFDIELKFDDHIQYQHEHLVHVLQAILKVVFEHAKDRPIIFSSFQPDAAQILRKLQSTYPVFFLTNGGTQLYCDVRRNSLEEAIKLCLEGGLQGIVSEVRGIFKNPGAVAKIKEANLSLLSYGKLNNVPEAVYMQHLMGVEGVIVDLVKEISEAVSEMISREGEAGRGLEHQVKAKPQFSEKELLFLLRLIPELMQL